MVAAGGGRGPSQQLRGLDFHTDHITLHFSFPIMVSTVPAESFRGVLESIRWSEGQKVKVKLQALPFINFVPLSK